MAKKIIAESTAKQLEYVFSEISQNASALGHLLCECVMHDESNPEVLSGLLVAARSIAMQIGWASDLGATKLGSVMVVNGGPENWMMPPAYHDAVKSLEEVNG